MSNPLQPINQTGTFTAVDDAFIRDWARPLDEWLVELSNAVEGSEQDRKLVFRQCELHRLVVLCIYHPARGCDLWSNTTTPLEQHELLISARATLKLNLHDESIWSKWVLVMITWAALIVIQAVEDGAGEPDNVRNIRLYIEILKQMNEPKPSLCNKILSRLEQNLRGAHSPGCSDLQQRPTLRLPQARALTAWGRYLTKPVWAASEQMDSGQ